MAAIAMKDLLEAGVHFGHQTKRWNPKMKEYIFGERNGIYIIDLGKTVKLFREAEDSSPASPPKGARSCSSAPSGRPRTSSPKKRSAAGCSTSTSAGSAACSPTSRPFSAASADCAISRRWPPTAATIRCRRRRSRATRRSAASWRRTSTASAACRACPMRSSSSTPRKEKIAVDEARKLKIPVIGIVDTNCDPDEVDFVIPGNDDALRVDSAVRVAHRRRGDRGARQEQSIEAEVGARSGRRGRRGRNGSPARGRPQRRPRETAPANGLADDQRSNAEAGSRSIDAWRAGAFSTSRRRRRE